MDKIAELYFCKSKDHMFGLVVTKNNEVFIDKITPQQHKDGTAMAHVVLNGADLTASGILDDIIATLLKNTPVPSTPIKEKVPPEFMATLISKISQGLELLKKAVAA